MALVWWKNLKFEWKFPFLIVVLPTLIFLVFSAGFFIRHYQTVQDLRQQESSQVLALQESMIEMVIQHAIDKLTVITKTPIVIQSVAWTNQRFVSLNHSPQNGSTLNEDVSKYINLTISEPAKQFIRAELDDTFSDIVITEQNGFNIWGDYLVTPFDQREAHWWYQAVTNGFWIGDFQTDFEQGELVLPIAWAVKNESSDNIGVLKANYRLEYELARHLKDTLPKDCFLVLSNQILSNIITLPPTPIDVRQQLIHKRQSIAAKSSEESRLVITSADNREYRFFSRQISPDRLNQDWFIGILIPSGASFLRGLMVLSIVPTLVFGGLFLGIFLVMRRLFIFPLQDLYDQVEAVTHGKYDTRINLSQAGELEPLAGRINHLVQLLQNFARTKLDVESFRGHITRVLAAIKSLENKDYNVILPVLDNEWGVLNSELNILTQQLAAERLSLAKKMTEISTFWDDIKQQMEQASWSWSHKEKQWIQSWEVSAGEWQRLLDRMSQLQDVAVMMQRELKDLRDVIYSISDDLQIVKYHTHHFDRDVESTLNQHQSFLDINERMKTLVIKSAGLAQRAMAIPSANGFSKSVSQWADETVSTIMVANERVIRLEDMLRKLAEDMSDRPSFNENSLDTYKVIERNIETLMQLFEKTNNIFDETSTLKDALLNKVVQYQHQFPADIPESRAYVSSDKVNALDAELESIRQQVTA